MPEDALTDLEGLGASFRGLVEFEMHFLKVKYVEKLRLPRCMAHCYSGCPADALAQLKIKLLAAEPGGYRRPGIRNSQIQAMQVRS
jgi:hypothetical protein